MSARPIVPLTLIVPITASATTYGTAVQVPFYDKLVLVAELAAGNTSTLDVTVQESWDAGVTWFDVAHFTQVAANGTLNARLVIPSVGAPTATVVGTVSSAAPALAAGKFADGPWGPTLRLVGVTGTGTNGATATQTLFLIPWKQSMGAAA